MRPATRLDLDDSVQATIARHPALLPALRELGVETCCGGGMPLRDAVHATGRNASDVLPWLEALMDDAPSATRGAPTGDADGRSGCGCGSDQLTLHDLATRPR